MKIVFFDGHCNLCNALIAWLIRRDRSGLFKFAPLQGETAKQKIPSLNLTEQDPDTVVYFSDGMMTERSTAILQILIDLGGIWAWLGRTGLRIPERQRDRIYRFVARHRYKVFGRKPTCRVPTFEELVRFLK